MVSLRTEKTFQSSTSSTRYFTSGRFCFHGIRIASDLLTDQFPCGNNGEGCTFIETTLINGGSSTDISLIAPWALQSFELPFASNPSLLGTRSLMEQASLTVVHAMALELTVSALEAPVFVRLTLIFTGGSASCNTAFKQPDDTCVQAGCSGDNVSRF